MTTLKPFDLAICQAGELAIDKDNNEYKWVFTSKDTSRLRHLFIMNPHSPLEDSRWFDQQGNDNGNQLYMKPKSLWIGVNFNNLLRPGVYQTTYAFDSLEEYERLNLGLSVGLIRYEIEV